MVAAPHTIYISLLHRVKQESVHRGRACKQELYRRMQHPRPPSTASGSAEKFRVRVDFWGR